MHLIKKNNPTLSWYPSLFNDFLASSVSYQATSPAVNVKESDVDFILELAAPGVKKEQFSIELDQDILSISAKSETTNKEKEWFSRHEFSYTDFNRSFQLPDTVDTQNIKANHADGILTVTLPKQEEALPIPVKKIAIG